ncbi:MAG: NAD-dependent epimerase/dehydratase family protein [Candidatus Adiutrix intracellularis]|nr:NAD-dependent epimerase/dehydratase family protein [Candidatus Adiutrix intracellularis]
MEDQTDYIFHCAAVTESSKIVIDPAKIIETSILGTKNILALARVKQIKNVIYLS